ncbi:hypothetical protein E8Q33_05940 [Methylophaga sp. SB9B]|uniref:hypothetical protein n=1 Tax=Methylophaga sp. SB9B TaxID=2570356 RepID=UPI0010A8539E|nr:hypothetical protein [Methylophaga sp. SB9B]THK41832.1 hypothetical protein E8Q33_05940 [Methylophaga sp. SB9B]
MAKLVDLDHKWATLIGRVFIAFGSIERQTHESLKKWLEEQVYPHVKHMKLSQRIDLLIDVVKKQNFEQENIDSFVADLTKAKTLAKKRNLIAHNPLMLCLFQEETDFIEAIVSNLRDDVTMEFHELEALAISSEELAGNIIDGMTKFRLEGWEGLPITR